jgi:hypothetical protein
MPLEGEHVSRGQPQDDGLAAYRRLIELQKQMIELSQRHEQAKRDCAALREQVTREVSRRLRPRRTLRQRVQDSTVRLLKFVPGLSSGEVKLGALQHKEASSC